MNRGGRQPGGVRVALMMALSAGVCGTLDALVAQAGLPAHQSGQARTALGHLRRAGWVMVHGAEAVAGPDHAAQHERRVGRPRVVYGPRPVQALSDAPFDALGFARQVWR